MSHVTATCCRSGFEWQWQDQIKWEKRGVSLFSASIRTLESWSDAAEL